MKNILKYMVPCLALALTVTSCYDTMDSKNSVDSSFNNFGKPTLTTPTAVSNYFSNAELTGYVDDIENVVETGFQIASSSLFADAEIIPSEEISEKFSTKVEDLEGETTYYVRSYVVLKSGAVIVSDPVVVTTPAAPHFELAGTYLCQHYQFNSETPSYVGSYEMTISFVDGSETDVDIFNLDDSGLTLEGVYDATTNEITVAAGQPMGESALGSLAITGVKDFVNPSEYGYKDDIIFTFNPSNGNVTSDLWLNYLTDGDYAGFDLTYPTYVILKPQAPTESAK